MLVDAFLYFDEKELVELRIKYLNDLVDHFIVVEADVTHQGKKKEWNFEPLLKNNLKNFSQKIHYHKLKIDMNEADSERGWIYEKVKGGRSWKIENMQRNYIKEACKDFAAKDIIIISDLDEIPSKEKIKFIKSCDFTTVAPVGLQQSLFQLNCKYLNLEKWIGSVVTTKELIDKYEPQSFRDNKERISFFTNAGWSFSSFGGLNRVKTKFEAFAHEEYNKEEFKNDEHLIKCMEDGEDVFKRKTKKQKVKRDFFPKDLLKIMEENPKFYFGTDTAI